MNSRRVGYVMDFSLSAILTSSGKDLASIFFIAPMHFDGGFTGTEFCCNLLIKHPGNDEAHHLALADDAIPSERSLNRIEQILVPIWLCEKLNRARLHGLVQAHSEQSRNRAGFGEARAARRSTDLRISS